MTQMTGSELKEWRKRNGLSQSDLTKELGISSRQTISTWENSESVPRVIELAVCALDQVESCRILGGYEKQFKSNRLANRHFDTWKKYKAGGP